MVHYKVNLALKAQILRRIHVPVARGASKWETETALKSATEGIKYCDGC